MDTSTTADFGSKISETGVGSEFDVEGAEPWEVAGIIIGRGCFEMDSPDFGFHKWFGAVYSDGFVKPHLNCSGDDPLYMHGETKLQYSQCVVQNVLKNTGAGQSQGAGHGLIPSRALREILR